MCVLGSWCFEPDGMRCTYVVKIINGEEPSVEQTGSGGRAPDGYSEVPSFESRVLLTSRS